MVLTDRQRLMLQAYQEYRQGGATWVGLGPAVLRRLVRWIISFGGIIALACYLLDTAGAMRISLLCGGGFLGAMGRELAGCRYTIRVWPVLQTIIDWPRVQDLLQRNELEAPGS
jgi:hypothetical protein